MTENKSHLSLAGMSPHDLLQEYHAYLFDDYLPFVNQYVVDHEYGGFLCHTNSEGKNLSTNKRTWYDGRGIWVYSFLYNNFDGNPEYLTIAKKTVELVLKAKSKEKEFWPWSYDQQGNDLQEPADIYGNLFVAEGLTAFAAASGDWSYWDQAKSILLQCVEIYDREDYRYRMEGPGKEIFPVPRVLGHWMIMLRLATGMLREKEDNEVESIAKRCVEMLLDKHLNPEFNLMNEALDQGLRPIEGPLSQFVYIGHAIEALWMVMDEAIRKQDEELYNRASTLFKHHVEVAWDDVYGGVFHGLDHVDQNIWLLEKVLWAQEEVLTGLMLQIEHDQDPWAYRWFDRVYHHVTQTYPLKKHGYVLWSIGGDRKVTYTGNEIRVENYHHPRHLMLNMLKLKRLMGRSVKG